MLCSRFKQILPPITTKNNNKQCRCLTTPSFNLKKCRRDSFFTSILRNKTDVLSMSTFRFFIKDLRVYRFWSVWTRNVNVGSVVRRCRRDRSVREVFQSFRQTFLRTPKSLLISATAALKAEDLDDEEDVPCELSITDEDLQLLLTDLESIQELSKKTLYCERCKLRLAIENKKISGVKYCACIEPLVPDPPDDVDGWVPYMEADDVIIWRKEYKPGQGLFAYKACKMSELGRADDSKGVAGSGSVYGRYNDVTGQDFAAIQVDGYYRKIWDTAVADLSIVERSANGVMDQFILHWEVLWPRLFANRDYVYIRRHKEFDLDGTSVKPVSGSGDKPSVSEQKPSVSEQKPVSEPKPDLSGQKGDVSGQKSGQKPDVTSQTEGQIKSSSDQIKSSSDQIKSSSDQIKSSSDKKLSSLNQNEKSDESETSDKLVSHQTDSRGTKITIIRNKSKKPKEEINVQVSGDNKSADKLSVDEPSAKKTDLPKEVERPSVHSNAKRKAQEVYDNEKNVESKANKAYVIISRSCSHPKVPPSSSVIRVTEYWSNMVIRSLKGADHVGMEFVLTYYDEPAVGGLPTAVSSFAAGRAAPAFLARMRIAAKEYAHFIQHRGSVEAPDFRTRPKNISYEEKIILNEEDMESSKLGPEINDYKPEVTKTSDRSTQTEDSYDRSDREKLLKEVSQKKQDKSEENEENEKSDTDDKQPSRWRQLYPFYYFGS